MIQMKERTCSALIMEVNFDTLVPVPLNQQPEVRAWLSEHTLPSLWLCGLKHLLLFGVCVLDGMVKQLYLAWRCTWHIELLFFLVWDNRGVIFPLVYSRRMWMNRPSCDIVSHGFFPFVSRLICIQDVTFCPDMNHWMTCILDEPVL